jgi:hypothetical protein
MRRPLSSVLLNVSSSLGIIRVYIWWLSSGKYIDTTYGGRRSEDGEDERALSRRRSVRDIQDQLAIDILTTMPVPPTIAAVVGIVTFICKIGA